MVYKITLNFGEIFKLKKPIIGVVHLPPLPGSPSYRNETLDRIFLRALKDAESLVTGGVDGLIIENFWDAPFKKRVRDPLTLASFTVIAQKIVERFDIPVGLNLLRNSAVEAAAIASVVGAKFIRVNVYVETIATDSGVIEPAAPTLIDYLGKRRISVGVLADVHVKHGRPLGERDIIDVAKDAVTRGQASAVIVTGERTGSPPNREILSRLRDKKITPVIIGSGLTKDNLDLLSLSDGAIVGTYFKEYGDISMPVDKKRVLEFMELVESFR